MLWSVSGKPFVIDLSHHNANPINFAALKTDGVRMVIHKCSQGTNYVDPQYTPRRRATLAAGLLWEAYHFADASPVAQQLAHFLAVADLDEHMRGALDFEPNGTSTISPANANAFAAMLDGRRGSQCLRYTGAAFLTPQAKPATPWLRSGPLWLAKYGPMPTAEWLTPMGIDPTNMVMWQYTDKGQRKGIKGTVDQSWWLGTAEEMDAYPKLPSSYSPGTPTSSSS